MFDLFVLHPQNISDISSSKLSKKYTMQPLSILSFFSSPQQKHFEEVLVI